MIFVPYVYSSGEFRSLTRNRASTLENWTREFDRFAPEIDVQTYYGSQAERAALRDDLKRRFRSGRLEVVLASYTQVASPDDLGFFRKKIDFEVSVLLLSRLIRLDLHV
jgi:SNF2 family DNA or RNA helicase